MTTNRRRVALIAATLILLAGCSSAGSEASKPTTATDPAVRAEGDVLIHRCDLAYPRAGAQGTVTNSSPQQADYTIAISFIDVAGSVLGQGDIELANIEPGQQAAWQVGAVLNGAAGKIDCKVGKATRTPTG